MISVHHAQVTIPAGQEQVARKFYCELLGLREIPKPELLRARGGFWLDGGNIQIHVGVDEMNEADRAKSKSHLAYHIDDTLVWRERLSAAGVPIIEGTFVPGYSRFESRDPFGNRVEFIQTLKKSSV